MSRELIVEGLVVDPQFAAFIKEEALPGLDIDEQGFWQGVAKIVNELGPINKALLERRDALQSQIDGWHRTHKDQPFDASTYRSFLREIGYLGEPGEGFSVTTQNIDREICEVAGPQLVVPVSNARYALNAANARWGSLYDALYGTDVIAQDGAEPVAGYDPKRGEKVIAFARDFLDESFPLKQGSYKDAEWFEVVDHRSLLISLKGVEATFLASPEQFVGYRGEPSAPSAILLRNHGLHVEIQIDRSDMIGQQDGAGIADLLVEAALSTIMDCEDSVAVVDTPDKIEVYRNWLGLMKGDLSVALQKKRALCYKKIE